MHTLTVQADPEQATTALEVLKSKEPNFRSLQKHHGEAAVKKHVNDVSKGIMKIMWPTEDTEGIAMFFAEDIVETRPDWKQADIKCFFKFIRQNQGDERLKVYGKLSSLALMQMVAVYEEHRAEQREILIQQTKSDYIYPANVMHVVDSAFKKGAEEKQRRESMVRVESEWIKEEIRQNKWTKDFNILHNKKPLVRNEEKYIFRYGRVMSLNDFLHYKRIQFKKINTRRQ